MVKPPKKLPNGCYSLLKEYSIRFIAHSAPVEDQGTIVHQHFSISRGFIDALNNLTLDILGHCLTEAANDGRRLLTEADVPMFTELMKNELDEMRRASEE